jgi:uncharacterized protein (TIGR03545 family)
MRWKGIIFLIAIVIIFLLLGMFFTSALVKSELENLGTTIVGAKVEIDDLDISLIGLHFRWERLQVTDPDNTMKNMLETGKTEFDLEFVPLLSGKVIIESIMLAGVQSGTDRETDGAIGAEDRPGENSFIASTVSSLKQEVATPFNNQLSLLQQNINVDSILTILEIESIDKMKNLQINLSEKYNSWESRIGQISIEEDARFVEQQIKSLDVNKAKSIDGFQKTINEIQDIKSKITSMEDLYSKTKNDLMADLNSAQDNLSQVDDWIKQDYSRALAKANLAEINAENIGKLIFGNKLVDEVSKYLSYIGTARTYSEKYSQSNPEKKAPPRFEGQDIYFSGQNTEPDFWIKKINLSGKTTQNLELSGDVKNLVSNQKLIGSPTEFKVNSKDNAQTSFSLEGIFNYIDRDPGETIKLSYTGFSLAEKKLSDSRFLPDKLKSGIGSIAANINLHGESIEGTINFSGKKLEFESADKPESKTSFEEIIYSIIDGIDEIDFRAKITGSKDNIRFSLNSNLDDVFSNRLKNIAGEKITAAKARIRSEIEKKVNSQQNELKSFVSAQENQLRSKFGQYEDIINQNNKLLDAKEKEAEKIFENEKSKIKDKVKDLFKF